MLLVSSSSGPFEPFSGVVAVGVLPSSLKVRILFEFGRAKSQERLVFKRTQE